jgi:hypothetical protein
MSGKEIEMLLPSAVKRSHGASSDKNDSGAEVHRPVSVSFQNDNAIATYTNPAFSEFTSTPSILPVAPTTKTEPKMRSSSSRSPDVLKEDRMSIENLRSNLLKRKDSNASEITLDRLQLVANLQAEALEDIKLKTMFKLVEDIEISIDGRRISKKLLYLSNKQAASFGLNSMQKVFSSLELKRPNFVIKLLTSLAGRANHDAHSESPNTGEEMVLLTSETHLPHSRRK